MKAIQKAARDPEKMKQWITEHKTSVHAWTLFILVTLTVFIFLSDRDFSFLLTLSSLVSMFCFFMVAMKIERSSTCAGVSLRMMECYLVLLVSRLCSIIPFEGYLPYDRTGDWLYQLTEAVSLCLCGTNVFLCRNRYRHSYKQSSDALNPLFLIVPCLVVALILHPSLNAFVPADIAWTFALYLEAVASLPQLIMFHKEKRVEPFTTHFLAGQALSKVLSFIFWFATYTELNDPSKIFKSYVGYWVMGVQAIQLILMGDFVYHYIRCLSRGIPVQFFLNENV